MCHFFSGIIQYKHKGVWFDLDIDHHTDIMAKFNVKDEKETPTFVKFEITPEDGDYFNHAKENWKYQTDQDNVPDWFDPAKAAEQAWNALQEVFAARFLIGTTDERTISEGRWFIKDAKLKSLTGTANIQQMRGTSQVGEMRGTSKVGVMWETSKVGVMWETSKVGVMWETSKVGVMWETSQVGVMRGTSQVGVMRGTSQVGEMRETSKVGVMWETSKVGVMWGTSKVEKMKDQSMTVRDLKITVVDKRYTIEYLEA